MTEIEKTELEETFIKHLKDSYNRGLRVGIKTACRLIEEKLKDTSKPILMRVKDVQRFCHVATENISFVTQNKEKDSEENDIQRPNDSVGNGGGSETMHDHDVRTAGERKELDGTSSVDS